MLIGDPADVARYLASMLLDERGERGADLADDPAFQGLASWLDELLHAYAVVQAHSLDLEPDGGAA